MYDIIYNDLRNFENMIYEYEIIDNRTIICFMFSMKEKHDLLLKFAVEKDISLDECKLLDHYLYEICYDFIDYIERGGRIEHNRQIPRHN